jgi:phosphoglycolate phosphatase-like HAD superfamily hydrolase
VAWKGILFDFIGTTVWESIPDTVSHCFNDAFQQNGIIVNQSFINQNRGKNKREVIQIAIGESGGSGHVDEILKAFDLSIALHLSNFSVAPDAQSVFNQLKSRGIRIGLGSGLSRDSFDLILNHLNWRAQDFDYLGTAEEVGKGRPDPAMIFNMMRKLNIVNPKEFLKVGDTVSDIQEGKNAGVVTMALLAGTQPDHKLLQHKPDFAIASLSEILNHIN